MTKKEKWIGIITAAFIIVVIGLAAKKIISPMLDKPLAAFDITNSSDETIEVS